MSNHHFQTGITVNSDLVVRINLRWGETEYRLPGITASVLRHIDGRTKGWKLLEKLSHEAGEQIDQAWLVETLDLLRRSSVITFKQNPSK